MNVREAIAKAESVAVHLEYEIAAEAKKLYDAFVAELRKLEAHANTDGRIAVYPIGSDRPAYDPADLPPQGS